MGFKLSIQLPTLRCSFIPATFSLRWFGSNESNCYEGGRACVLDFKNSVFFFFPPLWNNSTENYFKIQEFFLLFIYDGEQFIFNKLCLTSVCFRGVKLHLRKVEKRVLQVAFLNLAWSAARKLSKQQIA